MRTAAMGAGEVAAVRMERSYPPGKRDPGNRPSCWGAMTAGPRDVFIIDGWPRKFCEIVHKRSDVICGLQERWTGLGRPERADQPTTRTRGRPSLPPNVAPTVAPT